MFFILEIVELLKYVKSDGTKKLVLYLSSFYTQVAVNLKSTCNV